MRTPTLSLLVLFLAGPGPLAAAPADLTALEQTWHGCVRGAYAGQPSGRSRAASQRSALDACRDHEDRYVAAVMASAVEADRPLAARARAWASSVAASLVDPVAAWIGTLRR